MCMIVDLTTLYQLVAYCAPCASLVIIGSGGHCTLGVIVHPTSCFFFAQLARMDFRAYILLVLLFFLLPTAPSGQGDLSDEYVQLV